MSDSSTAQPTISDYAASMAELLDSMSIQEADLMGYHTGSRICVELARQQPDKIKNLILISAPLYNEQEVEQYKADYGKPATVMEDGSHLIKLWKGMWKWRGPQQTAEDLMKMFPDHIQGGNKKHWGHMAAQGYSYEKYITKIKKPILVLNTNDDLFEYTKRIRQYLANGKVLELKNWGHGFLDYHTLEAAQIVRQFVDKGVWPTDAK
jgi:pimeloyl-ACP methyl ester carboxylesterase